MVKLLFHGVETMRLSLKKVYKNPLINGEYFYSIESQPGSQGETWSEDGCDLNNNVAIQAENGVTLWPLVDACKGSKYSSEIEDETSVSPEEKETDAQDEPEDKLEIKREEENVSARGTYIDEEQINKLRKEGYNEGLARAEEECQEIKNKANTTLKEAESCLQEARKRGKDIVASSERKIIELSMAVTKKLIQTQLEVSPETIMAIVQDAIAMLNGGEQVEVFVNPDDMESSLKLREQLLKEFTEFIKLEVCEDKTLPRGSCRIETESGLVEYLIDEEIDKFKEILLKIVKQDVAEQDEEREPVYGKH